MQTITVCNNHQHKLMMRRFCTQHPF